MARLLYVAFALSGAAALIYESIWSRYLGLFVGHAAYAQVLVLVVFLGGMALGALAAGVWTRKLRDPLLWYAGVELAVGLAGLAFHPTYVSVTRWAYDSVFPGMSDGSALTLAKWGIAAALIFPQSVALGATFPLMAAGVLRKETPSAPGRTLAILYFVNGLGAAIGVLIAGFYLVGRFGLPGTVAAAAWVNVGVALLTGVAVGSARWRARRRIRSGESGAKRAVASEELVAKKALAPDSPVSIPHSSLALLGVAFGTALASFIYEIAWIRMLSLVLGSATHSFELMLSAFILGLSLGAFWVRSRADRFANPVRALGLIQWTMGLLAVATLPLYLLSFEWMVALMEAFGRTDAGYDAFNIARYALCLVVMLPATFCAGMTLPLITSVLLQRSGAERSIGMVYGLNTLGSVVGAEVGGLVLLPLLGLKGLLVTGASLDVALGALLLWVSAARPAPRIRLAGAIAATTALLTLVVWRSPFEHRLLTSGVYRTGLIADAAAGRKVIFYRDGRTASVAALVNQDGQRYLVTNGKPDASLGSEWLDPRRLPGREVFQSDGSTQALLALITLAHVPGANRAAVIGHGSGMSSQLLLGSPHVTQLETIEIEPEMIQASNVFYPLNRRVFEDPRSVFVIDDAKAHMAAASKRYDLILSEPSNPWVSGVSGLFTVEFYRQVNRYLSEGGIFGQWLHLYEMNNALVLSVLAAVQDVFPAYEVFMTGQRDILIVATNRAHLPPPDWSVVRSPLIAEDLRVFKPLTVQTLEALRVTTRAVMAPLVANGATPNSDYHPVLDLGAERARYVRSMADDFTTGLTGQRFDPFAALQGRRIAFGVEPSTATPELSRPRALARGAALRAAVHDVDFGVEADIAPALLRHRMHEAWMARGAPPPDWRTWVRNLVLIESDLHNGTAGVADERFYDAVYAYMRRARAPASAVRTVDFLHAIASWNFAAAVRTGDPLVLDATLGDSWLPIDVLRDGLIVAKLKTGDAAGASKTFTALGDQLGAKAVDLRSRLLAAHILSAAAH